MDNLTSSHHEAERSYSSHLNSAFAAHVSTLTAEYRISDNGELTPTIEFRLKRFEDAIVTVCVHQGFESVSNSYNVSAPSRHWDEVNVLLKRNLESMRSYLDQIAAVHFGIHPDGERHLSRNESEAKDVAISPSNAEDHEYEPERQRAQFRRRGVYRRSRELRDEADRLEAEVSDQHQG